MTRTRQFVVPLNKHLDQLEALPQPVVAYGRDLAAGESLPLHHHTRAQLVYASDGVMSVTTHSAVYVVPPQRAVWLPAGVEHSIDVRSALAMRTLYINSDVAAECPETVAVLQVTALLRELIVTAVAAGPRYEPGSAQSRIVAVILDQLNTQPMASLGLQMPTDARALRIAKSLIRDPADSRSLDEWGSMVGASKRTLGRLFTAQTGMSFGSWRQQRRLLRALELMAAGNTVTNVALELGYNSTSAFIAMFRQHLGTTPTNYLLKGKSGALRRRQV